MTIPNGVERVVLMIRHSTPPKTGTDANKTLTDDGALLCQEYRQFYAGLVINIMAKFGVPSYHCSLFPRSFVTLWELFHAPNINIEPALKVWASLTAISGGEWFKEQQAAGKTEPEMIRAFLDDSSLMSPGLMSPGFEIYERNYTDFIVGQGGSGEAKMAKFAVAVCHEVGISLAAHGHLPDEQLGLDKCEAVLFFVTGGIIVGAEKIVPERDILSLV